MATDNRSLNTKLIHKSQHILRITGYRACRIGCATFAEAGVARHLLTSIAVGDAACEIVRLYRLHWRIEEVFRAR